MAAANPIRVIFFAATCNLAAFQFSRDEQMIANSRDIGQSVSSRPAPMQPEAWHLWTVIIPRRSITGRLVWGTVWRRNNGRGWIYKKFVEYSDDGDLNAVS
jgi:hypothetical protein